MEKNVLFILFNSYIFYLILSFLVFVIFLYYLIKTAVKNAIIEALSKIEIKDVIK